jgi:hypothetical protein
MPPRFHIDRIRDDIVQRWRIPSWPDLFPWWAPAHVTILVYADGSVQFDGGPFYGLKQVIATLTANHYPWVRFDVVTAHRHTDPSADHQDVDLAQALALGAFDELWIYSFDATPLTPSELAAAKTFMDSHSGGVLITGDHKDLGAAFGNLPRAGKMRLLPAPDATSPVWNNTLREGHDPGFQFEDQSDDVPQPLTLKYYNLGIFVRRPHPVLCSPFGPIDIFPDHQHEGEALAPAPAPASEWPAGIAAEVIAWGRIVSPDADTGRRFGVLSAYDGHPANVGRVVADSTWHHHFDINLLGDPGLQGVPAHSGFVTLGTADWLTNAKKIEQYFVNLGVWLAPPERQSAMRAAAWWGALFSDAVVESYGIWDRPEWLGRYAIDALGRYSTACTRYYWIIDLFPRFIVQPILKGDPGPWLEYAAGIATRQLQQHFEIRPDRPPPDLPSFEEIDKAMEGAGERAMEAMITNMEGQAHVWRSLQRGERD